MQQQLGFRHVFCVTLCVLVRVTASANADQVAPSLGCPFSTRSVRVRCGLGSLTGMSALVARSSPPYLLLRLFLAAVAVGYSGGPFGIGALAGVLEGGGMMDSHALAAPGHRAVQAALERMEVGWQGGNVKGAGRCSAGQMHMQHGLRCSRSLVSVDMHAM